MNKWLKFGAFLILLGWALIVIAVLLVIFGGQARGQTNATYLGELASSNQFILTGKPPFVVGFEHMEIVTNRFEYLNYREATLVREAVPDSIPPGLIRLTVREVGGSATNAYLFTLPKSLIPAPRVRLGKISTYGSPGDAGGVATGCFAGRIKYGLYKFGA